MALLKEIFGPDKLGILPVPKNIMDLIREGLRDVTNEGGTAGDLFKGFPINVAGKTGTAENAHGRDHGWFVAYAPYDKHKLLWLHLLNKVALVRALQVQSYVIMGMINLK